MAPISWFFIFMGAAFLVQWGIILYLIIRNSKTAYPQARAGARAPRVTSGGAPNPGHIDIDIPTQKLDIPKVSSSSVRVKSEKIKTNSNIEKLKNLRNNQK